MADEEREHGLQEIEEEIRDLRNKKAFGDLLRSHVNSTRGYEVSEDTEVDLETVLDGRDYDIRINFYELDEDQNPKTLIFELDSDGKRIQQILARARWITGNPQVYLVQSKRLSEEPEFLPDHLAYAAKTLIDLYSPSENSRIIGPVEISEAPGSPSIS